LHLPAESLIDKAIELNSIGGQYGQQRPSEFLSLALKLLQLQPEKEIIQLYLDNEDYKYLTALAAFYVRLTYNSADCYKTLEPFLMDKRKLRSRDPRE
jgi:pre-mRNA-splicing factor 38A